jgi:HNH endonuclease
MSVYRHLFPLKRGARCSLPPAGRCIYCGSTAPPLSDEHILPDGLGGDLILPRASCAECAKATHRCETHLIKGLLQYPRSLAGVRSRKRKGVPLALPVLLGDSGSRIETTREVGQSAPVLFPFPVTDDLPGIMSGYPFGEGPPVRLALFGQPDWLSRGRAWLGGSGEFKMGFSMHLGVAGQALAKIAHAFACAKIGRSGFEPFLVDYICANEPPLDAHHIGIHSSIGTQPEVLHYLDLQLAHVTRRAAARLVVPETVYVVYVRLFAQIPSPSILVVVGRPVAGALAPFVTVFDHRPGPG